MIISMICYYHVFCVMIVIVFFVVPLGVVFVFFCLSMLYIYNVCIGVFSVCVCVSRC